MSARLGIDAGQTGTRAALAGDGQGRAHADGAGVTRLGGEADAERLAQRLLEPVRALEPYVVDGVGVGLSGFEAATEAQLRAIAETISAAACGAPVAVATDGLTALLGALGDRDGVVIAAGTGTACLGRRGTAFAKADGWGPWLGDHGSGSWIGRRGLVAALDHHDGRDPAAGRRAAGGEGRNADAAARGRADRAGGGAALAAAAERRFGALAGLTDLLHRSDAPAAELAAFARDVLDLAASGDTVAMEIADDAAAELARTCAAVLGRLFAPGARVAVSWTGGVLDGSALLRERFAAAVREHWPSADLRAPAGDPLTGALALARTDLPTTPGVLWRSG